MRTSGLRFALGGAFLVLALVGGLWLRGAFAGSGPGAGGLPRTLSAAEADRLGIQVAAVGNGIEFAVSAAQARRIAGAAWVTEPGTVDTFLQSVTEPGSERTVYPMLDRTVWIVRYSGLSITSPGGRAMHTAYTFIDAQSGEEMGTRWLP